MAIMHPSNIDNISFQADSEEEVYSALRDQLSDKCQVFYSVRWFPTNTKKNTNDSECDFLVFDPAFGFLVLEVKGGSRLYYDENKEAWFLDNGDGSTRRLNRSPYKQAENNMRHFTSLYQTEYAQRYLGTYGFAVVLPHYPVTDVLGPDAVPELTIDCNDMDNLAQKIKDIFFYWKKKNNIETSFASDQRKKFLALINKRVALDAAKGALIKDKEKEFSKIDFFQSSVLDMLYNYRHIQMLGGAGTGKTYIAIKKVVRDMKNGKKVLFLSCNNELTRFVKKKICEDYGLDADVQTYEELISGVIGKNSYESAEINKNGNRVCFDLIGDVPEEKKFDSIVVDEGQDFDDDMGLSVRSFLKSDTESDLYVFYDENQNIYGYKGKNAFSIESQPFLLRYNIRNTGCIYEYAVKNTTIGEDTISNQIQGAEPVAPAPYNKASKTLRTLIDTVNQLIGKEGVSNRAIVILCEGSFEQSILSGLDKIGAYDISHQPLEDIKDNEICVKTVEEFKGLEANVVIYLKNDDPDIYKDEKYRCQEYVALTRARYFLYVFATKCKN